MPRQRKAASKFRQVYFNPKHKGSFGGKDRFLDNFAKGNRAKALDWLRSTDTYTLHRPVRRNFPRRNVIVGGIDNTWCSDLCDVQNISSFNDHYKYILVVIDVFSKYAMCEPVKNKTSQSIKHAFDIILSRSGRKPLFLWTDKGKEFTNAHFQEYLKGKGISHYTTENDDIKASVAERFIRTLKERLYRYFTHTNSKRYLNKLQEFVTSYNNTTHTSIKMPPSRVTTETQEKVYHNLYPVREEARPKFLFSIGDKVRISTTRMLFRKGYEGNWSEEIFSVSKRSDTSPPVYSLQDYNGEPIAGTFYEWELQLTNKNDNVYKVEKIIGQRKLGGRVQYLVKWLGYPDSFNSYVDKNDVIKNRNN